jgi:hypothetical protein
MEYVKAVGIAWGLIYFVYGSLASLALNNVDFWGSVTILFATFLLPLPLVIVAAWFPRIAGKALLVCMVAGVAAGVAGNADSPQEVTFADICIGLSFVAMYNVPHLVLGLLYIKLGRSSKNAGSCGEPPLPLRNGERYPYD